jgi:hypothetical protein
MKNDSAAVKIIVVALNHAPVWLAVPDVTFKQGTASSFDLTPFVSDPQDAPMTFMTALVVQQLTLSRSPQMMGSHRNVDLHLSRQT